MDYYYIKLGRSNSLLPYWLQLEGRKNPYECPSVCIYFYDISIDEYREIDSQESFDRLKERHRIPKDQMDFNQSFKLQIKPFIEEGKKDFRFITIDNNIIYILEPISEAEDLPGYMTEQYQKDLEDMRNELQKKFNWKKEDLRRYDEIKDSTAKIRKVKILKKVERDIPHILLTLSTVRYYNSGTFRRINPKKNIGIYRALEIILGDQTKSVKNLGFDEVLELLSPHQFETLVFLIFNNANIYSPAWRAGSLPGIDLIGINYFCDTTFILGPNSEPRFPPSKEVKFQIKRKRNELHHLEADYTIAISSKKRDRRVLTAEWLYSVIKNQEKTIEWLNYSLSWYIKGTKFKSIMQIIK